MAFIQERRIVIPMEWLLFPSEVSLLLVSHSSCLWVRIRKQLTHYVGCDKLHIVKDVVVVKLFPSIHLSHHPSMDGIIQGRKRWQK